MSEQLNPLVADYLRRKKQAELEQAQAEQSASNKELLGAGLQGIGALMSGGDTPVVYRKGWNEKGVPTIAETAGISVDTSPLTKSAERDRARGKEAIGKATSGFFEEQKVVGIGRDDEKRRREEEVTSEESQLAQTLAKKMLPEKDFSTMSAAQIKTLLPTISKMYDSEWENKFKQAQITERRAERAHERGLKEQEREAATAIPGYGKTGEVRVKPEEAVKLRGSVAELDALEKEIKAYQDLVDKHGSFELFGDGNAQMESLSTSIGMRLKNLYELGALSGPDMAIIQSQITSPTSMKSLFSKDKTVKTSLGQTLGSIRRGVESKLTTSGYRSEKQPGAFPKQVRNPQTGEVATVSNEQELQEAMAEGFQ